MLSRKELISYCLTLPDSYEDYPFDDNPNAPDAWTVMRHKTSRKSFAMIFEHGGHLNLNLKCEPAEADFLRGVYPAVTGAYHMNKEHWNGVVIDGSVPKREILSWILESYRLTCNKKGEKFLDKAAGTAYNVVK